jgi:hypothetical protein
MNNLQQLNQFLQIDIMDLLPNFDNDSDLINICQDMMAFVNQALFLLRLK